MEKHIETKMEALENQLRSSRDLTYRLHDEGNTNTPANKKTTITEKLSSLEQWQWMVMGGFGVVVWLISNINISTLIKLFTK